ncbi:hypothetical protein HQ447_02940 [bacterium]|nr:hypothetical protein [bacterium]
MIHYADTSFLCSTYRKQEHSAAADLIRDSLGEPLHFTTLLEFEFLQAIELQVWLTERWLQPASALPLCTPPASHPLKTRRLKSALHHARRFPTFDTRQRALASHAGLELAE